jgi:hypothetical protein
MAAGVSNNANHLINELEDGFQFGFNVTEARQIIKDSKLSVWKPKQILDTILQAIGKIKVDVFVLEEGER